VYGVIGAEDLEVVGYGNGCGGTIVVVVVVEVKLGRMGGTGRGLLRGRLVD
jgi:hypothetical protein